MWKGPNAPVDNDMRVGALERKAANSDRAPGAGSAQLSRQVRRNWPAARAAHGHRTDNVRVDGRQVEQAARQPVAQPERTAGTSVCLL